MATEKGAELQELEVQDSGGVGDETPLDNTEGTPPDDEELDYKALLEQERADKVTLQHSLEREQKARRDERIAGLSRQQSEQRQELLLTLVQQLVDKRENGDITEADAQAALRKGIADVEDQVGSVGESENVRGEMQTIYDEMAASMSDLPASADKTRAIQRWEDAREAFSAGRTREARLLADNAKTAFDLASERANKPTRRAADLNPPRDGRRASGTTDQEWLNLYSDEEGGGIPATAENKKKAEDLWGKGLRPKVRTRT